MIDPTPHETVTPLAVIDGSEVVIHNLTIHSPAAAAALRDVHPDEHIRVFSTIVSLGAEAWRTVCAGSTLRLVQEEITHTVERAETAMGAVIVKGQETADERLTKVLAPFREGITQVFAKHFGDESTRSVQAQLGRIIKETEDHFGKRLEAVLEEGDESALGRLRRHITDELQRAVVLLTETIAQRNARSRSNLGGFDYEDELAARLAGMATMYGDTLEKCAATTGETRKRAGDITIELNSAAVRGRSGVVIVVECKRRGEKAQAFSPAAVKEELAKARANRSAAAGILVTETAEVLPLGMAFVEYGPGCVAVAWSADGGDDTALALTYRLVRGALIADILAETGDVDRQAAVRVIAGIREALSKVTCARTQHNAARNAIDKATIAVDELWKAVTTGLDRLDEIIGA